MLGGEYSIQDIEFWATYYQVPDVELLIDSMLYINQRTAKK